MQTAQVLNRLRAVTTTMTPGLRVVGLVYTGLGGMLAMVLVVSVALVPVSPVLQQAAEPARQAISSLTQPSTDVVTSFFVGAPAVHADAQVHIDPPGGVSLFSHAITLDVIVQDALAATPAQAAPLRVVAAAAPRAAAAPAAPAESPAAEPVDEIVGLEPLEISAPHAVDAVDAVVAQPTPALGLQIASQDAPKALPPVTPVRPETALQIKARLDAVNQAAIDAAKAAQARTKAEADAANDAAIAARKAAFAAAHPAAQASPAVPASVVANSPAASPTPVTPAIASAAAAVPEPAAPSVTPSAVATPTAAAPGKAAANAANQAAIDAAKAAQLRARSQADTANQTALAAAAAARSPSKTIPPPTVVQPTPTLPPPTPAAVPAIFALENQASVSVASVEQRVEVDEASLESAPIDQATTLADDGTA